MDSSDFQSINSTESPSCSIADNSSMITPSKRDIFLSTYNRRQRFTLPDSMMHYIAKNPKNAKVYQKLIKRCKYFFIKNPILVVDELYYGSNGWMTLVKETWKNIDINRISTKVWITDQLYVCPANVDNISLASSIIPKIYRYDATYLYLSEQIISLNEFMFLCSSVEDLRLNRVTVKNGDGNVVPLVKLVEQLPQLKIIYYTFTTPSNSIAKNIFKQLWKIPHILNYDYFSLQNIPADFDIENFYTFMKKNKKTRVYLSFSDKISEEYKDRLEAIVDEIIATKNRGYKPPYIDFPGLAYEKRNLVLDIFYS